jgi:hypothetical protein
MTLSGQTVSSITAGHLNHLPVDGFDKRRGAVKIWDRHGELIRWSDQLNDVEVLWIFSIKGTLS